MRGTGLGVTVLSGILGFVAGSIPTPAQACSCALGMEGFVAPANGEVVPRNARIWVGGFDAAVTLLDASNQEVPLTRGAITVGMQERVTVFTPTTLLEPSATYHFERFGTVITFTTTNAEDHDAPAIPTETGKSSSFARDNPMPVPVSSCGNGGHATVSYTLQHNGIFTLVELLAPENLDESSVTGTVGEVSEHDVTIGRGVCLFNWPGADEGESTDVRFATVDLAGNFSGWSQTSTATVETVGGCAGARPDVWGLMVLVALGLLRRPRTA